MRRVVAWLLGDWKGRGAAQPALGLPPALQESRDLYLFFEAVPRVAWGDGGSRKRGEP